ncbi:MAG: D-alanine--D-alanine ligase, partial [Candidatus Omnitrophota bacterium]
MTNRTKRERIGVLAGGPSSEREISLLSGSAVHGALISAGCDAVLIDVTGSEHVRDEVRAAGIDIAFIALHGRFGEDGSVQTVLEEMGIPYTGSGPEASKRALDKIVSREIFAQNRIAIPRGFLLRRQETAAGVGELETAGFSLPLVVKPPLEGSSIGVSIVSAASDFAAAAAEAFRYSDTIIIEEYIK